MPVSDSSAVMQLLAAFVTLLGFSSSLFAAPPAQNAPGWSAQWIGTSPRRDGANQWLCFRRTFETADRPERAIARIACDSKYWLWLNGRLVVFEGQLKRGPTPDDTYYDTVDLTKYLRSGKNTVAVLVWHFGKQGFSHNDSGRAGLVFEMADGAGTLASDSRWKALPHPAYGDTAAPHPNFRLPESNVAFNARRDIPGWTTPGFDDSAWPDAAEMGAPPAQPWGRLHPRPIPPWRDFGLREYANKGDFPRVSDGGVIVAKLPYNAHVTPYLEIDAPEEGMRVGIQTDNYRGGGPENVRAEYVTRAGRQSYESLGWMSGHEVHYQIPAGVKIRSLKYRETGYDADTVGAFECDNPTLNALWRKAFRTLYVTMRDTYMDCPERERAQWWGDEVNEIGESFYVFDYARGPLLARKGIHELVRWQKADGVLYSPVPAGLPSRGKGNTPNDGTWDKELPPQMLASVGWYGFWTYYWYTGDRETIVAAYPAVRRYLSLYTFSKDGLVEHRPGGWDWTDWGKNIDQAVSDSAWYYLALKAAIEMARLTGNEGDVADYETKMRGIEASFNRTFWTGSEYRSPGYKGATDDRVHALAVVAGLAKPEQYPGIRKVLATQKEASPYMEKYVLEALYLMDAPEQAVARMTERYRAQIASPLTTLWEGWGIGPEGFGGGTYNHAWSGGPLTVLCQYAAGIAPTAPGWTAFRVRPQPGPLKRIRTITPTPFGALRTLLTVEDGVFRAEIDAPKGAAGMFELPKGTFSKVTHNGRAVDSGQSVKLTPGRNRIEAR